MLGTGLVVGAPLASTSAQVIDEPDIDGQVYIGDLKMGDSLSLTVGGNLVGGPGQGGNATAGSSIAGDGIAGNATGGNGSGDPVTGGNTSANPTGPGSTTIGQDGWPGSNSRPIVSDRKSVV